MERTYLKPVDEEHGRQLLAQRRTALKERQKAAAARLDEGVAALRRLVAIAKGDTGQSSSVADFLLAWWNPARCGGFDMRTLWGVDGEIADDMVTVFRLIADQHLYPTAYDLGDEFEQLVVTWRPQLIKEN
jgi:hypothetical protein